MFVMGGTLLVVALGFRTVLRLPAPYFADRFHRGKARAIDAPLLTGAALYSIGWGIASYCPGRAIASLGFGNAKALWFLPAMTAGAGRQRWQARRHGTGAKAALVVM